MAATLLKTNSVTIAATDNAASVSGIPSPGFVAVQIVGAMSATITFEASVDGTNYVAFNMTPSNSGTDASTATAAGAFAAERKNRAVFEAFHSVAFTSAPFTPSARLRGSS